MAIFCPSFVEDVLTIDRFPIDENADRSLSLGLGSRIRSPFWVFDLFLIEHGMHADRYVKKVSV
jgi:hypothetical protein